MKRSIASILALVATTAVVFTACNKDDNGLVSLKVEVANYDGLDNAKMYVDNSRYTHWTTGDKVNINSNSNTYSVDLSGTKASISAPSSTSGYMAVYPAGIASYFGTYSSSISVTLPETQVYSVDGSGNQIINAPMYAYCAEGDNILAFHNLCSLLKVTVNNDRSEDITMRSITITASNRYLSGSGTINNIKTDSPSLSMSSSNRSVSLSFAGGIETLGQGENKTYYVVVPSFTSTNITIAVEAATVGLMEKSVAHSSAVMSANVVAQGPTIQMSSAEVLFTGLGTAESPFLINNLDDLNRLKNHVNAGKLYDGKHFKIMNDIDCGTWTGIGNSSSYLFGGILDGNGKTITYTVTNSGGYNGLFKHIGAAVIKNLNVECTINNAGVATYSGYCGGIAGYSYGTTYQNCTASGTITGSGKYYGGITGRDNTSNTAVTINGCTSSVNITSTISGDAYLGGIVGDLSKAGSRVDDCSASGDISGASGSRIGGIVGNMGSASCYIVNCTFTGTVTGASNANSIVGYKGTGRVTNCTPADQND